MEDIQITTHDLDDRISSFVSAAKARNDISNVEEFTVVVPGSSDVSCARTMTRRIERKQQIKSSKVDNQVGPLSELQRTMKPQTKPTIPEGAEERVWNLEDHLRLLSGPTVEAAPRDVYARIKACEDRIMALEKVASTTAFLDFLEEHGEGASKRNKSDSQIAGKKRGR